MEKNNCNCNHQSKNSCNTCHQTKKNKCKK